MNIDLGPREWATRVGCSGLFGGLYAEVMTITGLFLHVEFCVLLWYILTFIICSTVVWLNDLLIICGIYCTFVIQETTCVHIKTKFK